MISIYIEKTYLKCRMPDTTPIRLYRYLRTPLVLCNACEFFFRLVVSRVLMLYLWGNFEGILCTGYDDMAWYYMYLCFLRFYLQRLYFGILSALNLTFLCPRQAFGSGRRIDKTLKNYRKILRHLQVLDLYNSVANPGLPFGGRGTLLPSHPFLPPSSSPPCGSLAVGRRTCYLKVVGSNPDSDTAAQQPGVGKVRDARYRC